MAAHNFSSRTLFMSSFQGKSCSFDVFSRQKSLFVLLAKERNACRSTYVVPRTKFCSFYVRAAIDHEDCLSVFYLIEQVEFFWQLLADVDLLYISQRTVTTPGTSCPTLYDKRVGSFTSPANQLTLKMQETDPTVYSPCPRRLESLTVC